MPMLQLKKQHMKYSLTEGSKTVQEFVFPSKRQFPYSLLFEIPSGGIIKRGVQKAHGKNNSCLKKKGNCLFRFSSSGLLWDKSKKLKDKNHLLVKLTRQLSHRRAMCYTSLWFCVMFFQGKSFYFGWKLCKLLLSYLHKWQSFYIR